MANEVLIRLGVTGGANVGVAFQRLALHAAQFRNILVSLAGLGGLGLLTRQAINAADEMGKMAQKTGVAVEALSQLSLPAKLAGVEMGQLQNGIKNLSEEMVRTGRGSGDMRSELLRLADVFAQMPDGPEKTARAVREFGRAGLEMIPLLNQGSAALREQMQEADEFGLTIGPRFAREAERFNDNLTRIQQLFRGIFLQLSEALLPELIKFTEWMIAWTKESQAHVIVLTLMVEFYKEIAGAISQVVSGWRIMIGFFTEFRRVWDETGSTLQAMAAAQKKVLEETIEGERRLAEIRAIGERDPEASETIVLGRTRQTIELQRQLLTLRIKEKQVLMEKLKLDESLNSAERAAMLREELSAIQAIVQERRKLSAEALQSGEISQDRFREFEVQDQLQIFRAQQEQMQLSQETFTGRMMANLRTISDEWGNLGRNMADVLTGSVQIAVQGVSDAIMGAIDGTKTWGQVFTQVARSIVAGIIQMAVQWIASMTILAALKRLLRVEDNIAATASATAWAPAAVAASIASYGAAAAIGGAAFAAAMVSGTALTAGLTAAGSGFQAGGFTGAGGRGEPAGVVHRGEFVIPADRVNEFGVGFFEDIRQGLVAPQQVGAGGVTVQGHKMSIAFLDSRNHMREFLQSAEGEAMIVDIARQRRLDIGVNV